MGVVAAVLSGFALAPLAPGVARAARGASGWLLALLPAGLVVYFVGFLDPITTGGPFRVRYLWVPALGVELSFTVDGLALLFALLICAVGALVLVYAGGYLAGHPQLGRLYAFLLLFMASMLGLVLADNLLLLFVFWELTSFSSYLLIGFDHGRPQARAAALQALLVTGGGGLALLAGLLLVGGIAGTLELSELLVGGADVREHPLYGAALALVLLGAFTKSAQFPFHFWLPGAMEAPTPVSAYLHSATMVKAGVYLLARLSPVLGGTAAWLWAVTGIGAVTMLAGGWLALAQTDLKRILAYSTVSALGVLTFLLGVGGEAAVQAAAVYLLGHALYKGALFLVAGAVDHETGTRDVERLGGLAWKMPLTALAAAVAALSLAGLPPLFGFLAKELVYEATLHGPAAALLTGVSVIANAFLVAVAGLVAFRPFWGRPADTPKPAHEAPMSLWLGPLVLAGLGVVFGLWPGAGAERLLEAVGAAVLGRPADYHLVLWHGWNLALTLSAVTLAGGVAVYVGAVGPLRAAARRSAWGRRGPAAWYDAALRGLNALAAGQTALLQSGYLRYYLLIILAGTVGLTGYALTRRGGLTLLADWSDVRFYEAGLALLIVLAALAAVLARRRLAAIAALGVVGYGVALVFVLFGGPDLAMTQFLVETLTVIVFVLVFYHLPEPTIVTGRPARARDALFALAAGALMAGLVLVTLDVQHHASISPYYVEHSLPDAHGRNVVNVILVDFRALDTLGEITVLAAAGVGVYALLKLRPGPLAVAAAPAPPDAKREALSGGSP